MKILIGEDDMTSRLFMKKFLSAYGQCELAVDGLEVIEMAIKAIDSGEPFDLISLDIMMPKVDGIKALKMIREYEKKQHSKIIMTTAINDKKSVELSYEYGCDAYAWKPIDIKKYREIMKELNLI
ncbi:MAG: response regulator [Clostridia bacterium]|nr:response regulator [Clostridia bacterium]